MGMGMVPASSSTRPFEVEPRERSFSSGTPEAIDMVSYDLVRVEAGPSGIWGFAGGQDGRRVALINASGVDLALNAESTFVDAEDRIISGGITTLTNGRGYMFIYDGTAQRWRVLL